MSDDPEVLVRREGAAGRLNLNRPTALHARPNAMCLIMTKALLIWRDDPAVGLVIIDKDNAPLWFPEPPEDVDDALFDEIFTPLSPEREWAPLSELGT